MSKVSKIILVNFLALFCILFLLSYLLKTYTVSPTFSFTETCVQIFEYYGITFETTTSKILALIIVSMMVSVTVKLVLSLYKINQRTKYINLHRTTLNNDLYKMTMNLGLEHKVCLIAKHEHIALIFGLLNPKIVISTGLVDELTSNELEAVLLHEKHHLKSFHSLYILSAELVKNMLFFLPVLRDITQYMREHMEYEADMYTSSQQKSSVHLKNALKKVRSTDLSFLPAFSSVRRHDITKAPTIKIRYVNTVLTVATTIAFIHVYANKPTATVQYTGGMCISNECVERCLSIQ